MKIQPDNSESRFASGLKALALIVLLGLIAVVSEPVLHSKAAMDEAQMFVLPTTTQSVPPANAGDGATYFPSQYPAPTKVEEQAPTF
jgi:hypothetical protein